jgi:hypothetical protein
MKPQWARKCSVCGHVCHDEDHVRADLDARMTELLTARPEFQGWPVGERSWAWTGEVLHEGVRWGA